jgi:phosphoribosylglycinamide formyltransferase-1
MAGHRRTLGNLSAVADGSGGRICRQGPRRSARGRVPSTVVSAPSPAGPRLGVLASGAGTILEAILDAGLAVAAVVVDRPCRAVDVAARAGVPSEVVARTEFGAGFDRPSYTAAVVAALEVHRVDVVAMAGFGTVLAAGVFERWPGRVLNTHPALLPAFKGWHAVRAALEAGVAETGCTVHVATEAVDDGPILAQEAVPVLPGDTEDSLHERIKSVERRLYPATIATFLAAHPGPFPPPVGRPVPLFPELEPSNTNKMETRR